MDVLYRLAGMNEFYDVIRRISKKAEFEADSFESLGLLYHYIDRMNVIRRVVVKFYLQFADPESLSLFRIYHNLCLFKDTGDCDLARRDWDGDAQTKEKTDRFHTGRENKSSKSSQ